MLISKATMKKAHVRFNYEDYLLLPEDKRYEILDGDLQVVPAPGTLHQRISIEMEFALLRHVKSRDLGVVLHAPCDVLLSHEDIVQPDILFIRKDRQGIIGPLNIQGAPDLVIEILSPGGRDRDLKAKRKLYARFEIPEYWIVDPEAETVEVLAWSEIGYLSGCTYGSVSRLSSPLLPDLKLPLSEVFGK